ncbi:hypothetical protein [Polyangium aurulentum]|uniref:hypothetical protein n=1 Tax=Polyangium aurulentum TaxID=2567896 RepID=UPI00146E047C|nr:hypothetical protein [Polyangium aurulentum]UQA63175.1 hypothetical protein E8A73_023005 [Polyangium aurulentum]
MSMIEARKEEAVMGVSIEQFALVCAGLADGFALGEMLELAGSPAARWPRAEAAWHERLLADLDAEGALCDRFEAEKRRAWARIVRPLPPLDADLRAWLDFDRAHAVEIDSAAFLARFDMRPADMERLSSSWAGRLEQDGKLRALALEILAEEPGPVPVPRPMPPALPREGKGMP